MKTLRTPDSCFAGLPDYPFAPHYAELQDHEGATLRAHYLDEGPEKAAPVVLLHGEPSWSYLYRHMIPGLVEAGHRVIAPDQIGFGRSDKPTEMTDYSYERHVRWMSELLFDHLHLANITFFGQDWGGLIGLRLVAALPDRFDRVIIGNTGLPTGEAPLSDAFLQWQKFSQDSPTFPIGELINRATVRELSAAEIAAYDAPFPDDSYKAGARIWPSLVPTQPDDPGGIANAEAWTSLADFHKPFLLTFSDSDPVTAGGEAIFARQVPGAANQPHLTITGAGHFLQEDKGPQLANIIHAFIDGTR